MINNMPHMFQVVNLRLAQFQRWAMPIIFLIFSTAIFSSEAAFAADVTGTLSIQVSGFPHQRGHVIANLFREEDDVLKHNTAYRKVTAEIHDGKASINFPDLAYGKYAVSVFQDENDNGTLDHNAFKFPAEPLGFSNHFKLGLFSGFPSFEKLQFPFTADTGVMEITLK